MTTDELAAAAAAEIRDKLAALLETDPVLDSPREFTKRDRGRLMPGLTEDKVRRELRRLAEIGELESGFRYDPRTQRRALAYWFPQE